MRPPSPLHALLAATAALLLSACDPAPSTGGPTRTAANGACFPLAPLRLVALEHGREWEPVAEVEPDGIILQSERRRPLARIAGDQLVDGTGRATLICTPQGEITMPGHAARAHFGANDEWVDGEMTIFVADDGAVTMTSRGRPVGAEGQVRVEGPIRNARRTAVLLVVVAMMGGAR